MKKLASLLTINGLVPTYAYYHPKFQVSRFSGFVVTAYTSNLAKQNKKKRKKREKYINLGTLTF